MITSYNNIGEVSLRKGVFKDIVSIIVLKNNNFIPTKKDNGYISPYLQDNKLVLDISLYAKKDIDVVKESKKLQNEISEAITSMLNIEISNINIDIKSFVN